MRAYFTSDKHIGDGRLADDSLAVADAARNKAAIGVLREFAMMVQGTGAQWYIVGDLLELYACSERRIWQAKPHKWVLRDVAEAVTGFVWGNHDWGTVALSPWREATANLELDLDGQRVWLEHGHAFDGKDWSSPLWKLGARAAYWAESSVWPGLDEWALKQWRSWQDRQRAGRNRSHNHPGCVRCSQELPLAWAAGQRFDEMPDVDVVIFGHTHEAGTRNGLARDSWSKLYANTGTWTRNPAGQQRLDVLCYDSKDGWSCKQATELL